MKTIQYGIDLQTGLIWSRYGNKVAVPILDYANMKSFNRFTAGFYLNDYDVLDVLPNRTIRWTRKISKETKNLHRKFWGLNPLKE